MTSSHAGSRITDEMVAALRQRIGIERPVPNQFNQYATTDTIRHFAHGIGDLNPLWLDPDHARTTRFGGIIAPPTFPQSCNVNFTGGMPGVHAMHSGSGWTFYRPLREGDRMFASTALLELVEKQGVFAGRMFQQIEGFDIRNQRGELVAHCRFHCMRTERDTAASKGKYLAIEREHYSPEDLAKIDEAYEREEIRGAIPRFWEDVGVGDGLGPIVKGPLTVMDVICYLVGSASPFLRPHRGGYLFRKRHPLAFTPNELGVPDAPERGHWDNDYARRVGVPGAYDYGFQRVCWLGQLMTNWIGDDAWLQTLDVKLFRFFVVGDTAWCRGKVVKRWIHEGRHLVECELQIDNQRGEAIANGSAIAILPSKDGGTVEPLADTAVLRDPA